jgi:hypothetical protein
MRQLKNAVALDYMQNYSDNCCKRVLIAQIANEEAVLRQRIGTVEIVRSRSIPGVSKRTSVSCREALLRLPVQNGKEGICAWIEGRSIQDTGGSRP